jgi:hypothetical protein
VPSSARAEHFCQGSLDFLGELSYGGIGHGSLRQPFLSRLTYGAAVAALDLAKTAD